MVDGDTECESVLPVLPDMLEERLEERLTAALVVGVGDRIDDGNGVVAGDGGLAVLEEDGDGVADDGGTAVIVEVGDGDAENVPEIEPVPESVPDGVQERERLAETAFETT